MGVEEIYNTEMSKPFAILGIFNEHFGEDKVDMQGFPSLSEVESAFPRGATNRQVRDYLQGHCDLFILVHFPQVTITNEHDRSTDIKHLYAKVSFGLDGKMNGRFTLNRAEYTMLHISNDYMHSHVSNIPFDNFERFQTPCTGSGPINNTICSLVRDFDADLWRLFCLELDRYVHVESIAGTPYHRLESLVQGGRSVAMRVNDDIRGSQLLDTFCLGRTTPLIKKSQLALFVKYLIDKEVLKFNFVGGEFNVAMSNTEAIIKVSNCFIEWYNKMFERGQVTATMSELIANNIIVPCKYTNGYLVRPMTGNGRHSTAYNAYVGRRICTFKGQVVTLRISDLTNNTTSEENQVIILKPLIINYIITKILNVINFRYGNKRDDQEGSSHKKVYFV